jgi:magnesium and cobalt exporter, CNNM family
MDSGPDHPDRSAQWAVTEFARIDVRSPDNRDSKPGNGFGRNTGRLDHTPVGLRMRRSLARLLVRSVSGALGWVNRLLRQNEWAHLSEAELRQLLARSTVLDRMERQLIDDVLAAGDRHVRELMVPRTEVVFLDAALSVAAAARLAAATRHSRFPVIDASQDDVVGFVHLRDLLVRPDGAPAATVGDMARDLHRLPASKRVLAALSEMRRAGDQVALVVDEYGGTAGIVTLEDLIEELVGEIHDEYDAAPVAADDAAPTQVEGLLNLNDFAQRTGLVLPAGPYDTVGGYIMSTLGRLPRVGDEVPVSSTDPTPWRLTVSEMDGRRVARVTIAAPDVAADAASASVDLVPGLATV